MCLSNLGRIYLITLAGVDYFKFIIIQKMPTATICSCVISSISPVEYLVSCLNKSLALLSQLANNNVHTLHELMQVAPTTPGGARVNSRVRTRRIPCFTSQLCLSALFLLWVNKGECLPAAHSLETGAGAAITYGNELPQINLSAAAHCCINAC